MLTGAQTQIVLYGTQDGRTICPKCHVGIHEEEHGEDVDFCDCSTECEYSACESGDYSDGLHCDICDATIVEPDEEDEDEEDEEEEDEEEDEGPDSDNLDREDWHA